MLVIQYYLCALFTIFFSFLDDDEPALFISHSRGHLPPINSGLGKWFIQLIRNALN